MFLAFLFVVAAAGFGYLVYKNGMDGAVAIVAAGATAVAAWASGIFDKLF